MLFSAAQIEELLMLVDANVARFIADHLSDAYLTSRDKQLLKDYGWNIRPGLPVVEVAYKFGMLSSALGDSAKGLTFPQFRQYLSSKRQIPLSTKDIASLDSLQYQAYHEIKGLGNRLSSDFSRVLVDVDKVQRKSYEDVIRGAAQKTIIDKQTVSYMSSLIGEQTKDWARDLDRISDYILHDAHDHGRAAEIEKRGGGKVRVYKHVFNQACKYCVDLYLTSGFGSQPKFFSVQELRNNGSNIGRKSNEWKPVLGPTHLWCRCELETVPIGSVWNDEKKKFAYNLSPREEEIKRKLKMTFS